MGTITIWNKIHLKKSMKPKIRKKRTTQRELSQLYANQLNNKKKQG